MTVPAAPVNRFVDAHSQASLYVRLLWRARWGRKRRRAPWGSMTEMETVQDRLRRAVERVEQAVARPDIAGATAAAARGELAALQAERDRLGRALVHAKSDNAALRAVADQVTARLDRAIEQLKLLLGR